ncbi:4Fe-4S dicluster domain-containing protein [Myxococcota bacterium]|nr:4Fe-4S dicluster domain-containing protein [Myxococcota bacterium]
MSQDETPSPPEKVKKAPPKKGKKGAEAAAPAPVTVELLRAVPLFRAIDEALLTRLCERVSLLSRERGERLHEGPPVADDVSPVFVVLEGDVAVERAAGPDATAPLETMNYLRPGEAWVQKLFADEHTRTLRLTAMVPMRALQLTYGDINALLKRNAPFRDDFSAAIRDVTERQVTHFDNEFQKDIAKFFVEQRLTFAGRVKVKRMDICIECDGCYDACRTRHGTDRLGSSEVKFGLTEIPANCHNCGVPECLDKCKFGHLSRHPETNEIIIDHNCVGCTACAKGCSFGSIRMHTLAELDLAKYFPNRSPDAKGKNIAQKCDNCSDFGDQACVTACPTGALFQVDGSRLFDYWQQFAVHTAPGQAATASPERHPVAWRWFFAIFTALNALLLTWECFGRLLFPELTFGTLFHAWGLTAQPLDPVAPFRAGDWFSHGLGYVGGAFLLATQLYRLGRRFAPRYGSMQFWMETHVWFGVLGGLYGFFHTAFVFSGVVSTMAFLTMVAALVTGFVGRYILYLVPRSGAGTQLELKDLERRMAALDREMEQLFESPRAGMTAITHMRSVVAGAATAARGQAPLDGAARESLLRGLLAVAGEDQVVRKRIEALGAHLEAGGVRAGKAGEVLALMQEQVRLERSVKRHAFFGRLLKRYRTVHVIASNIMFGALLLHIVVSLAFAVGN